MQYTNIKETTQIKWEITVAVLVAVEQEFASVCEYFESLAEVKCTQYKDLYVHGVYEKPIADMVIRYVLAKLPHPSQGGDAAAWLATRLVEQHKPFCLCMIGLCAGDSASLKLGDVIMASSTIRLDFGKLVSHSRFFFRRLVLLHRKNHIIRDHESVFHPTDMGKFASRFSRELEKAEIHDREILPRIHLGVMATGNQVVKVPGIFAYLKKMLVSDAGGDEYDRRLIGIDMEAHAVAFVAEQSKLPGWLVIKGVSDYGNLDKSDEYRDIALRNATRVSIRYIEDALPRQFQRYPKLYEAGNLLEKETRTKYYKGFIGESSRSATQAYILGCRSVTIRRNYIRTLMRDGDYEKAERMLEEYRSRPWFNDQTAVELLCEIYWRKGLYERALGLLTDQNLTDNRQLLYLKAITSVFLSWDPETGANLEILKDAVSLLKEAIKINRAKSPWWILVNYYFVLYLLKDQLVSSAYENAKCSISRAKAITPRKGIVRLYELLLFALANAKDDFINAVEEPHQDLEISLDFVDMVFQRIIMRFAFDEPSQATFYID